MTGTRFAFVIANCVLTSLLAGGDSNPVIAGCPKEPGVPVWAIPVRVMTPNLQAIEGLQASDFVLTENRIPHRICGFAHARQPSSTGILLDTSGSMGFKFDGIAMARAGINHLLDTSGPQDEYFLEYVNNEPAMQCIFSCDLHQIRAGLRVSPKGKTSLIDAIYLALNAMRKARHANRALLVISDAYDNASIYQSRELDRAISELPVPLFLIIPATQNHLRPEPPVSDEEAVARQDLVQLANRSGGYAIAASNKQEMISAVTQFATAIRSPYTLYFRETPARSTTQPPDVRVEVKGVRPHPMLSYRGLTRYAE